MHEVDACAPDVEPEPEYEPAHAILCRRGHVLCPNHHEFVTPAFCDECGAAGVDGCESCGSRLSEVPVERSYLGDAEAVDEDAWSRPSFCSDCGSPFPWVDRQGRIFELENLLAREDLDAAAEFAVREQLDALANPDLTEDEQRERWRRVKRLAPGLMRSGGRIIEGLASAAIRREIGI